jgi:transposase
MQRAAAQDHHPTLERFFNLLKHFRAVAARDDKCARNFLAGVRLAVTIFVN